MLVGYFVAAKLLKLSIFNSLGSITGGMTSTPALGTLIRVAGTDDVASAYAATYPIALVCVVLASQFLAILLQPIHPREGEGMSPKRESAAVPVPQRLILGCVLAFTGGFLDIYTYLIRGGVFANAQTSNLIFLGLRLMEGDWPQALNYFAQVASYVVGILVAGVVKRRIGTKGNLHWRQIVIFAEFILVTIIGYIPASFPPEPVNVIVAFICSVQVASFDSLEGTSFATTMCTGNLRQMGEHILAFVVDKRPGALRGVFKYVAIIVSFVMGAVIGTFFVAEMQEEAIWICCYTLFFVLSYLLVMEDG